MKSISTNPSEVYKRIRIGFNYDTTMSVKIILSKIMI